MKYFFALGNNPTLSIAEISAVFSLDNNKNFFLAQDNVLILETKEFNAQNLIKKMGSIIKIGLIKDENNGGDLNKIKISIQNLVDKKTIDSKFKFGLSYYGNGKLNTKILGMETKKYLKEKNISCRWVVSKEKTLSSVVVEQNKLTSKGIEVALIKNKGNILIGETLAVQPFKELSYRDYGRPRRDDRSGMLPPKLAQIMINLSQAKSSDTVLDPFCGSGTILTEAMLMGYKNLMGSDISEKAVEDTRKNITWIKKNYTRQVSTSELRIINYELINKTATELSRFIKSKSVDIIITEPYLGPQRGKIDTKKVKQELEDLYAKALQEFKKILKSDGQIVMIFPVLNSGTVFLNLNIIKGYKIINPIPEYLRNNKNIKLTNRNTIVYGREGQKVWREIIILK